MTNLKHINGESLLRLYSLLMEELRNRELIRSSNNPVADYAEKVAIDYLGLSRVDKEEKGYDALDKQRNRYQIKGRRVTKHNSSRQLGVIRNLDEKLFDFLVAVIFDEDFTVKEIWEIPYQFIHDNSKYSSHVHGHIFIANPDVLANGKGIKRIE